MTKNAKLLYAFLRLAGGRANVTRLMKLAYLVDLYAWRVLGRPISEFTYVFGKHGPFDPEVYGARDELVDAAVARGEDAPPYRRIALLPKHAPVQEGWSPGEEYLIRLVADKYLRLRMADLLERVVYPSEPMQGAQRSALLPMAEQKNKDRDRFGGISLEQILQSEEQFERGEYITLDELKARLAATEG